MDEATLKRIFPHASESTIRANLKAGGAGQNPKLEHASGHEPLGKDQGQETATGRLHIRFISVRKRLCDPDNLSPKYLLDCLRYCQIIGGDEQEKIILEVGQRRAAKGEREQTEIEIAGLSNAPDQRPGAKV